MQHLELWRLGTDILLMLSLIWLAVRHVRSASTTRARREVAQLDQSLKTLIKEADTSGRNLNEQLRKRQQELEKLLSELESGENNLRVTLGRVEKAAQNFENARNCAPLTPPSVPVGAHPPPAVAQAPEPPSFQSASAPQTPVRNAPSRGKNIYGDDITPALVEGPAKFTPPQPAPQLEKQKYNRATERYLAGLSRRIEKEIVPSTPQAAPSAAPAEIEDVYSAAERLIRAGKDLTSVAAQTRLSADDVAYLARMVRSEMRAGNVERGVSAAASAEAAANADTRLGVLAGMKRQVQAL